MHAHLKRKAFLKAKGPTEHSKEVYNAQQHVTKSCLFKGKASSPHLSRRVLSTVYSHKGYTVGTKIKLHPKIRLIPTLFPKLRPSLLTGTAQYWGKMRVLKVGVDHNRSLLWRQQDNTEHHVRYLSAHSFTSCALELDNNK